jgi:hypothetical protein
MDKHHASGLAPRYTLGLETVEIDAVLAACELVGTVLRTAAPEANARAAARLLAEATRDVHHDDSLTRSILVQVARALQAGRQLQ